MKKKNIWSRWINNIKEDELSILFKKKPKIIKYPGYLDKRIDKIVEDNSKEQEKEDFIKIKRSTLKYAFSFVIILVLLISISFLFKFFIYPQIKGIYLNECIVKSIKGNVYLLDEKHNKKSLLSVEDKLYESSNLKTDKDSSVILQIGDRSFVTINENSTVKLSKLYKNKDIENTKIFIRNGLALFNVEKLNFESLFEVETDSIIAKVMGTEFLVSSSPERVSIVQLNKGELNLKLKLEIDKNIRYIKKVNPDLAKKIEKKISGVLIVKANQMAEVSFNDLKLAQNEISNLIILIKEELKANKGSKEKIKEIFKESNKKIIEIDKIKSNLYKKKTLEFEENKIIPKISILSPENKYYKSNPLLKYKIENSDNITIYLNNKKISLQNNEKIKINKTGFYKLKIEALGSEGKKEEKEIEFFVNKLKLRDSDNFNREDSTIINKNWYENNYNKEDILFIRNNKLIAKGSKYSETWGVIQKDYDSTKNPEIIQKIDVYNINILKNEKLIFFNVWAFGPEITIESQMHTSLKCYYNQGINKNLFSLTLVEFAIIEGKQDPNILAISEEPFQLYLNKPISFIFYIDRNNYYTFLIDSNNRILQKIEKTNYKYKYNSVFNSRGVQLMPFDNTDTKETLIEVDNYEFYE